MTFAPPSAKYPFAFTLQFLFALQNLLLSLFSAISPLASKEGIDFYMMDLAPSSATEEPLTRTTRSSATATLRTPMLTSEVQACNKGNKYEASSRIESFKKRQQW